MYCPFSTTKYQTPRNCPSTLEETNSFCKGGSRICENKFAGSTFYRNPIRDWKEELRTLPTECRFSNPCCYGICSSRCQPNCPFVPVNCEMCRCPVTCEIPVKCTGRSAVCPYDLTDTASFTCPAPRLCKISEPCPTTVRPVAKPVDSAVEVQKKKNTVQVWKNVFIVLAGGVEYFNEYYDPLGLNLKDLSKQIACNIDDYTPLFEKFYDMYKDQLNVEASPMEKLLMQLIMECLTCHLTRSLFGSSSVNNNRDFGKIFNTMLSRKKTD